MSDVLVKRNSWVEKTRKQMEHQRTAKVQPKEDDASHLFSIKKSDAKDLKITYNRANRQKTLRGIRR